MTDDEPQLPWCRATIAGDTVTLNRWAPMLIRGGPAAMALERLDGIAIADLYSSRDDDEEDEELLVRFVSRSPRPESAVQTLVTWAQSVGYRRVWLPDRVVDLDPPADELGVASVRCPTCGLEWRDETPEFWQHVQAAGAFPGYCSACGGSLPEWEVVDPARCGIVPLDTTAVGRAP